MCVHVCVCGVCVCVHVCECLSLFVYSNEVPWNVWLKNLCKDPEPILFASVHFHTDSPKQTNSQTHWRTLVHTDTPRHTLAHGHKHIHTQTHKPTHKRRSYGTPKRSQSIWWNAAINIIFSGRPAKHSQRLHAGRRCININASHNTAASFYDDSMVGFVYLCRMSTRLWGRKGGGVEVSLAY